MEDEVRPPITWQWYFIIPVGGMMMFFETNAEENAQAGNAVSAFLVTFFLYYQIACILGCIVGFMKVLSYLNHI